jgi:hypothetical protein
MLFGVGHLGEGVGCQYILGSCLALLDVPQVTVGLAFSQHLVPDAKPFGRLILRVFDLGGQPPRLGEGAWNRPL